jgi:hypothetical protein
MGAKRTPQTAAKRSREQLVRERREQKAERKHAAKLARLQAGIPETVEPELDLAERDAAAEPGS